MRASYYALIAYRSGAAVTRRRSKPTQLKNPHKLTLDQHLLPRASIARFSGGDGAVECFFLKSMAAKRLMPANPIFCVNRLWSQFGEAGASTRRVESEFQALASRICAGTLASLNSDECAVVTRFHALVSAREDMRDAPPNDTIMPVQGHELSLDEQERLEALGVSYALPGGVYESRTLASWHILFKLTWATRTLAEWRWGVVRSPGPQFLVPDTIGRFPFVPVAPTVGLLAHHPDGMLTAESVRLHNAQMRAAAQRYYFAKSLSKT